MARGQRFNKQQMIRLRETLGLTRMEFAARIGGGVTERSIYRWERGDNEPQLHNLGSIADAFNVDIGMFFEPKSPEEVVEPTAAPERKRRRSV